MATTVDEITVNYEEEGKQLVKELEKEILTKGAWSTILFKYQDLDKATGEFKPPKIAIRRYQKRNGEYRNASKFTISSMAQARKMIEILDKWSGDGGEGEAAGDDGED